VSCKIKYILEFICILESRVVPEKKKIVSYVVVNAKTLD